MHAVSSTGQKYFVRLRHTDIPCDDPLTADFDGDGLNNDDELFWLCDPFVADSDLDGFHDGWEVLAGMDPIQNNADQAHLDPDNDGWDNTTEHLYGTNPNLADSDGDELGDPDDADPNDQTIDWPRAPEATRVWIPLTGYNPSTHGTPVALSNSGIALFEKAIWKAGVWKNLEWEKDGPGLSIPDGPNGPEVLSTTLRAIRAIDLADNGKIVGKAELLFADPYGGDAGTPGTSQHAVQWTEDTNGNPVMELTGLNVGSQMDMTMYWLLPKPAGLSPDGFLFTNAPTPSESGGTGGASANVWEWRRHLTNQWQAEPNHRFAQEGVETVPSVVFGGVWTQARNTVLGGEMGVLPIGNDPNALRKATTTSNLPTGPGFVGGALADGRVAFVGAGSAASSVQLRPLGNSGNFRPVPKLAGAAAINARGEAISHDGRFWQNGKWLAPVSEGNTPPTGTMHLHDLNDHGVMLASAGEEAGNGQTGQQYGNQAGLISPINLLADTNRDGLVNPASDNEGKDEWTKERGAIYSVNFDCDGGLTNPENNENKTVADAITWWDQEGIRLHEDWRINGEGDMEDQAPLLIQVPNLPEGTKAYIVVDEMEDLRAMHIFPRIKAEQEAIWGAFSENGKPWTDGDPNPLDIEITQWLKPTASEPGGDGSGGSANGIAAGTYTFGIEGLLFRGMKVEGGTLPGVENQFSGVLDFTLELEIPGLPERQKSGKVRLKVAPFLLVHNERPTSKVYVATSGVPESTPHELPGMPQREAVLDGRPEESIWMQDHVEIGYTQRPGTQKPMMVSYVAAYVPGANWALAEWPRQKLAGENRGFLTLGKSMVGHSGGGYGGNIELCYPDQENPLGRILAGDKLPEKLRNFLEAQEVQPLTTAGVDYFPVYHIDELISTAPPSTVENKPVERNYKPDPAAGIALLESKFPKGEGAEAEAKEIARLQAVFFSGDETRAKVTSVFCDTPSTSDPREPDKWDILHIVTKLDYEAAQAEWRPYVGGYIRIVGNSPANAQVATILAIEPAVAGDAPGVPNVDGKMKIRVGWVTNVPATTDWSLAAVALWQNDEMVPPSANDYVVAVKKTLFWNYPDHPPSNLPPNIYATAVPAFITVKEILESEDFRNYNTQTLPPLIDASVGQTNANNVIGLPALYHKAEYKFGPTDPRQEFANAFLPSIVNLQWTDGGVAVFPKQFGPRDGNDKDVFEESIKGLLGQNAIALDDWYYYHLGFGEVHCGSVAERLPESAWWTKSDK